MRPLSHHGSIQSSLDPDTTSIAFSHGSSAPILGPFFGGAPPLAPNKLVKRSSSTQQEDLVEVARRRSHRPTLRRPATSHQRSATLHQIIVPPEFELTTSRKYSFEQSAARETLGGTEKVAEGSSYPRKRSWTLFFTPHESEPSQSSTPSRAGSLSGGHRTSGLKRIRPDRGVSRGVHLVQPRMVSNSPTYSVGPLETNVQDRQRPSSRAVLENTERTDTSAENISSRKARKSISMTFSSAGNWVARTSGSIRRPKRGTAESRGTTKRHVSAPLLTTDNDAEVTADTEFGKQGPLRRPGTGRSPGPQSSRQRNVSSPLPPITTMSSTHPEDMLRPSTNAGARPTYPSGSSSSSAAMSQRRVSPFDRMAPVDGFESIDDDDTDFKSDTMFDSIRTAGSSRIRAVDTPLDSMYDESPPSTAGNSKTKRLSIQEIMGKAWDEDDLIPEEDENTQTPVRTNNRARFSIDSYRDRASLSPKEHGRFSLDDDCDDDWARDDDGPFNSLSPPSKGGSLNSRTINPNVRLALANISGNGALDAGLNDTISERPLSNLFDWAEPSGHDKQDQDGHSPRPRTAYAKQETDSRGGRSVSRKGPTPTHVRSQSVPVVHDGADESKPTGSKYGTWGISSKTVSEDWDEDFEFGASSTNDGGHSHEDLFAVPESIRATQPSVKAHSGQIREFSLLVNDLKRLCRHGRDLGLLDGSYRALWKEAEGVITLASPDEESDNGDAHSEFSVDLAAFDVEERSISDAIDAESLDKLDAAIGSHPAMSKTAVVRERSSPRRRSVFSPDDDIFGFNGSAADLSSQPAKTSRPRTPETGSRKTSDVNGVVRHVMEAMQHRSLPSVSTTNGKKSDRVHFDTNSLKALVKRAGDLRDLLSEVIRKVDPLTQSPVRTPRHDRQPQSSPAFIKVFDEPTATEQRRMGPSRTATSGVEGTSPEASPSSGIHRRMQMMTVS